MDDARYLVSMYFVLACILNPSISIELFLWRFCTVWHHSILSSVVDSCFDRSGAQCSCMEISVHCEEFSSFYISNPHVFLCPSGDWQGIHIYGMDFALPIELAL